MAELRTNKEPGMESVCRPDGAIRCRFMMLRLDFWPYAWTLTPIGLFSCYEGAKWTTEF
jgi:hypothetical protein